MNYETLEKQIKTLTESDIAEVSDFIVYLKLKERFSDFENQNSYKNAIEKWRENSKELFENEADKEFMQHAFDNVRSNEVYSAKEIW